MAGALTKTQLDELHRRLEEERDRILRVLGSAAPRSAQPDQETEIEEVAQRETQRTHDLEIEARERALLGEVDHALAKFSDQRYGLSERTGAPIPYARLRAAPWAREPADE